MKTIVFLLTYLFCSQMALGQCIKEYENYANSLDNIGYKQFDFLEPIAKKSKIIGFGEDTHGSKEFTQLPGELLKYLIRFNYKSLLIEDSFGEVRKLNDYINNSGTVLKSLVAEGNWRYHTEEFFQLLDWMKNYNLSHQEKIQIFGIEMQYVSADAEYLQEYLTKVDENISLTKFTEFKTIWNQLSSNEEKDLFNRFFELRRKFDEKKTDWIEKAGITQYRLAYQHLNILGQFLTTISQRVNQRKHDFRDIYMAENVNWIMNLNSDSKGLVWAHNEHIGDWVANGSVDVLGHQLRKFYGLEYFAIGTDFGTGSFLAYPFDANETGWRLDEFSFKTIDPSTFTYCLKKMKGKNIFLNLREIRMDEKLKLDIEKPKLLMSGAGARERSNMIEKKDIGKAFDAIIYLDSVSKITIIK